MSEFTYVRVRVNRKNRDRPGGHDMRQRYKDRFGHDYQNRLYVKADRRRQRQNLKKTERDALAEYLEDFYAEYDLHHEDCCLYDISLED